jgi:FKBP-type peptidyl-prolyl cis-trans isomerase
MNLKFSILLASGLLAGSAIAYTASSPDRRAFLTKSVTAAVVTVATTTGWAASSPQAAFAAEETTGSSSSSSSSSEDGFVTTESGLRYKVLAQGTGAVPAPGQTVKAHYTGK